MAWYIIWDVICPTLQTSHAHRAGTGFHKSQTAVGRSTHTTVAFYYVSKPTIVSCGLGDVLLQDHNEQLHRAAYCVLSLTDAKKKEIYI